MAFKFILTSEDIREKMFNFIKPVYRGTQDYDVVEINWIYGLYDDETGLFFTFVKFPETMKTKYFLLTRNGECYYFVAGRYTHKFIEIPDEIKHYSEVIESALKIYCNEKESKKFLEGYSDEKDREFREIKDRMFDRCRRSVEINCFEDAKNLLIDVGYLDNMIDDICNKKTAEKFHKFMPEDALHFLIGEGYREIIRGILSYGDNITEEERHTIIMAYHKASFICARGLDDLSVDLVLQAIKKGNEWGIETGGFMLFVEIYLNQSLKRFKDKVIELKPILDYLNENMVNAFYGALEMYRSGLNRLLNCKHDGFEYVFSTDEVRDTLFEMFKDTDMINSPFFNWSTGIYDKGAGIFMTMIYRNPPGREVFERLYKYVVMKDGEEPFIVYADNEYRTGEWFYDIPARYEYLSDKIKEGVALSQFDSEFRLNLSKEDKEKYIKATIAKMKKRVEEYKSCR